MSTATQTATTTQWTLDAAHSEITFKVKHLMISTVTGQFRNFNVAAVTNGADFSNPAKIDVTINAGSIDTNNEQRDGHLKSEEFFDAAKYNQILFTSTRYETNGDEGKLYGQLTIKDHTKDIVLQVEPGGIVVDPYGQTKAGFTVQGKISRKEFGLTWNAVTEAGQIVVADDIKFHAEIQLIKQS